MRKSVATLLLGASMLAAPAWAQTAVAPQVAEDDGTNSEIVVTGTRIVRDGYQAPTPVTVAPVEDLIKATPTNLPDALNKLPQFSLSQGPNRSAHNFANSPTHGNVLNLRGVGGLRTLILFDGLRVPPTTYSGSVDTNVIPNLLVERVEVVTGGASAAYGSDAVSGVVNFVLDKDFTGIKGVAQAGISQRGDNENYRVGAAGGMSFADGRGHVLVSGEYFKSGGMLRSERDYVNEGWIYAGSVIGCTLPPGSPAGDTRCNPGGALNPYKLYSNAKLTGANDYGKILTGPAGFPFLNWTFSPTGQMLAPNVGTPTGSTGFVVGGDGYTIPFGVTANAPLETIQTFARASYEFAPEITLFAQGSFSRSNLNYITMANAWTGTTNAPIFDGNPYLPAAIETALSPGESITIGHYHGQSPIKPKSKERTDFWMATAGLEGRIAGRFNWQLAYTHGDSMHKVDQSGLYNWQRAYAAIDAVRDGNGNIVCRVLLDPDPAIRSRYAGCQPLNILSGDPAFTTPAGYAYATGTSSYRASITQDSVAGSISGSIFELPAGPVDLAVGAEYRKQKLTLTSNADPSLLDTAAERSAYFAGLRGVSGTALFYWLTNVGSANGSINVKEAFAEIAVPVFRSDGLPGELGLNAAGRITDYSTSGTVKTWKLGATWKPVPDLLLRGAISRDIRAPNLFELFAGDQSGIGLLFDPVTNTSQNINTVTGGNPLLKPEKADTLTLGGVFSPSFIPGFSLAIDYYKLEIEGAIGSLNAGQIVSNCFNSGGAAPECALITRPSPTTFPTLIRIAPANISFIETSGIDFDASYRTELGRGALGLRLYANYLRSYRTQQFDGAPVLQFAGINVAGSDPVGRPKWRGTLTLNYAIDGFEVALTEQFIGKMKQGIPGAFPGGVSAAFVPGEDKVKAALYTDLTLAYAVPHWGGEAKFFLTVNNLLDRKPPIRPGTIPGVGMPTNFALFDTIGRAFTAGVRFNF